MHVEKLDDEDDMPEVEDPGPEPVEYKPVLYLSIGAVLGAMAYHAFVDHVLPLLR